MTHVIVNARLILLMDIHHILIYTGTMSCSAHKGHIRLFPMRPIPSTEFYFPVATRQVVPVTAAWVQAFHKVLWRYHYLPFCRGTMNSFQWFMPSFICVCACFVFQTRKRHYSCNQARCLPSPVRLKRANHMGHCHVSHHLPHTTARPNLFLRPLKSGSQGLH